MGGYSDGNEAQVLLDANWNEVVEQINLLRDESYQAFILNGNMT